jgi:hypothetical protein
VLSHYCHSDSTFCRKPAFLLGFDFCIYVVVLTGIDRFYPSKTRVGDRKPDVMDTVDVMDMGRPDCRRLMIPKYYLGTGSCLLRKYICGVVPSILRNISRVALRWNCGLRVLHAQRRISIWAWSVPERAEVAETKDDHSRQD